MLMEHFLCDDVGGKHNVCEMEIEFNFLFLKYNYIFNFSVFTSALNRYYGNKNNL